MKSFLDYIKEVHGVRKILVAGAGGVGKTSLVKVLSAGKSLASLNELGGELEYHRTLYLNLITVHASKMVESKEKAGRFIFFDVAGQLQQPLHAIKDTSKSTMGGVDLIMLVFDANNMQSLMELGEWIETIKAAYLQNHDIPDFILIKNKLELPSNIDPTLIDAFVSTELKIIKYFEVSSLRGQGLDKLKNWLVEYYFGEQTV